MDNDIVITGTGLVSSLGFSASETWDSLLSGKNGIRLIDSFDAEGFQCRSAAQVKGLNPDMLGIHPQDARIMDKHSLMLMKCSSDAFKESDMDSFEAEDIGFFAGMGMVDYNVDDLLPAVKKSADPENNLDYNEFFTKGYREIYPLWPLSLLNNISFCQVAINLDIRGENSVFSPHADSCVHAIAESVKALLEKKIKIALAGGVSEKVSPLSMARAHLHGILNISDKNKEAFCRPFSEKRSGSILGEGCGMLALEPRSLADKRGAAYMAIISGYGASFELEKNAPAPTAGALSRSMLSSMDAAGVKPSDINVVIAHGDGTYAGDTNEIKAINMVFGDCLEKINVFSSKGALGHLLAGSPAVDIILGISMLEHGIIPVSIYSDPLDMDIRFNVVTEKPLKIKPEKILINAQSYEGQCSSLIIQSVK